LRNIEVLENADMWDAIKIPVIVVAVIAVIVLIILLLRRSENAHAQKAEELARTKGWKFFRNDEHGLAARIEAILPGERLFAYNVREVKSDSPRVMLFDCEHREYERQRNSRSSTGCLIDRSAPDSGRAVVSIIPRNELDAHLLSNVVDLGDEAFGEEFNVICADTATARMIVNPGVRHSLLTEWKRDPQDYLRLVVGPGEVLLLRGSRNLFEEDHALNELIQLTQAITGDLARVRY
jgi:hypothetical protein